MFKNDASVGIRAGLLILLVVAIVGAVLTLKLPLDKMTQPVPFVIFAVLIIAITVLQWMVYIRAKTAKQQLAKAAIEYEVRTKDVDELFTAGAGILAIAPAAKFIQTFLFPQEVFARISEHVKPFHRSTWVRTTYTLNLHWKEEIDALQTSFVIPLHEPPRGRLLDGVRITGDGDKRVSSLGSRDQSNFIAAVLRRLIWAARARGTEDAYNEYIANIEPRVFGILSKSKIQPAPVIDDIVNDILKLPNLGSNDQPKIVASMIRKLADVNPVSVSIPSDKIINAAWPNLLRFTMERRILPMLEQAPGAKEPNWISRRGDDLRLLLDATLNRVSYNLSASTRTHSYHVEVEGPAGTYLAANDILIGTDSNRDEETEVPPQLRAQLTPRLGQRRSHVYVSRNDNLPVRIATKFYERAPGSLSTSFIASLAMAVMICLLAIYEIASMSKHPPAVEPWLLPALLAVPLAVATLAGLDSARASRHRSLLSHGINFFVILLALSAFSVASERQYFQGSASTIWLVLSLSGVALCITSLIAWIMRVSLERHFVRGKDR